MKALFVVWRLAVVVAGFIAACAAAACVLFISSAVRVLAGHAPRRFSDLPVSFDPGVVLDMVLIIVAYALLPAAIVIALAEWERWRRWQAYTLFGALLPAPVAVLIAMNSRMPDFGFAAQLPVAGATGGLAYWLVAGRRRAKA